MKLKPARIINSKLDHRLANSLASKPVNHELATMAINFMVTSMNIQQTTALQLLEIKKK